MPAVYFNSTLPQAFIIDPPNSNVDTLAPATREILELTEYANIEQAATNIPRIWFIIFQDSINEYTAENAIHPHIEYLDKNFTLQNTEAWEDIRIFIYIKNE